MNNPIAGLRGWPPLAALLERPAALTSGPWIGLAISPSHLTNGGIEPNRAVAGVRSSWLGLRAALTER